MSIKLKGSSDGSVSFDAPADTSPSGSDITLTLPTTAGSANQFLKNSGTAGTLEYSSMVETSTGIGVGTSSPQRDLHIHNADSSTNTYLQLTSATTGTGSTDGFQLFAYGSGSSTNAAIVQRENAALEIWTNNTERARLDSSGRLLINTATEIDTNTAAGSVHMAAAGGGKIYMMRNDGSTEAGNDLGMIRFYSNDGTEQEAARIEAEADGAHGTNSKPGRLGFWTTSNANSSPSERLRITEDGSVRIGNDLTAAAAGKFQVVEERGGDQDNDCNAYFETNAQDWNIKTYYNRAGTHYHLVFIEQGTERGSIRGNDGSNVTFNQGSDYRWKENIVEMTGTEGIEICKRLKPSKYNWIENREQTGEINTVDGFIAHEVVEAGVLGAVVGEKDAVNEDGSIKGQLLDYGQMTPVLSAGIKGLIAKVETLETQNTAQQAQIDDLLARVTALEAA